jgi:cbb3-type cytochrome oxidase subunit 3
MKVILLLVIMTMGCASSMRIGAAGLAGAVGALGGPGMAAVSAGAAVAAVDIYLAEDELGDVEDELVVAEEELVVAAETIEALTTGDVQALVDIQLAKQRKVFEAEMTQAQADNAGFLDKTYDGLIMLMKIGGILLVVFIIGNLYWTWKRKKKGEEAYAEQAKLREELDALKNGDR